MRLANKAGYNPAGLTSFLQKLMERNKDYKGSKPNGLFATHPEPATGLRKHQADQDGEAGVDGDGAGALRRDREVRREAGDGDRHQQADAKGVAGAGSTGQPEGRAEEGREEGRRRCSAASASALSTGKQKESTQASASAGGRALDPDRPDRYAAGGGNPNKVAVSVSAAELEAFSKGIA